MPSSVDRLMVTVLAGTVLVTCWGSGLLGFMFTPAPPPLITNFTPKEIDKKLNLDYINKSSNSLKSYLLDQGFRWCSNSDSKHESAYYIFVKDQPDLPIYTYQVTWTNTSDGKISGVSLSTGMQSVEPDDYKGYFSRNMRLGLTGTAISSKGKLKCPWFN